MKDVPRLNSMVAYRGKTLSYVGKVIAYDETLDVYVGVQITKVIIGPQYFVGLLDIVDINKLEYYNLDTDGNFTFDLEESFHG